MKKFFNLNYKNISSFHDETELFLSLISPQAKTLFDVKQLENEFKRVLKVLKLEKLENLCRVADIRNDCILIRANHPAIVQALNFRKNDIKAVLQPSAKFKIREIFIKSY